MCKLISIFVKGGKLLEIIKLDDFDRIVYLDSFQKELQKLYSKSQDEYKKYLNFLYSELHKIDNRSDTINREEPIIYNGIPLYSIRKKMKKNTRVLYYYMKDNRVILLTAFDEKNRSDYETGKAKAYNRLKILNLL